LNVLNPALSPDGTKVAFRLVDGGGNSDIWVRDLRRGADVRLTFDPGLDDYPVWSSDSKRIAFAGTRGGKAGLYQVPADQSGNERLVAPLDQNDPVPTSWSRDGRFLVFHAVASATRSDLWILPLETGKPCIFLQTAASENEGRFSPDSRWIAYHTDSSSVPQIYVRPFSSEAPCEAASGSLQSMVSTASGLHPRWSGDGTRLYYLTLNSDMMAVNLEAGSAFRQRGLPTRLFLAPVLSRNYDVDRASGRFLFLTVPNTGASPPPFTLVQNWIAALEK
jgi:Tol biopolymer transport system component